MVCGGRVEQCGVQEVLRKQKANYTELYVDWLLSIIGMSDRLTY